MIVYKDATEFLDSGPPRCYVPGLIIISAILCGDNSPIDITDTGQAREAGNVHH